MRILFLSIFSTVAILILGFIEVILLKYLNKNWWGNKYIKSAAIGLPIFGTIMVILWGMAAYNQIKSLYAVVAILAVMTFILEVCLMLSLPLSGIFQYINRKIDKFKKAKTQNSPIDNHRRIFLKGTAVALPLVTITSGVSGFAHAFSPVKVYAREFYYSNLPDNLENFKILHLSDLHLRQYGDIDSLIFTLENAEKFDIDITMVTGDIADDLKLLPDTLRILEQFKSKHGVYASLGNHEYFRGLSKVKKEFAKTNIPLLINNHNRIIIDKSPVFIGGIDDPVSMGAKDYSFYVKNIDHTLLNSKTDDFTILMSHRPDALDYSAQRGINLVLAGHTHGGQIGFNSRSIFEPIWADRYLWGKYFIGETQLYTSSGMGHWFPFRLGCPTEAPVITLKKGKNHQINL
ncbi:MAG: metallophosphoesterase [candidate division Zixibacteria bacterium]|nr:metallophosphoesterase [candidate division Zixibacteria bacterium]